ncbi:hypothetical protein LINPERHAP1_LOCUS34873 [Linum perenne]
MENDTVAISNRWLQDLSRGSNPQNLEGLTMAEGNWEVGAIATLIDDVGAAAIFSMVGHVKASLDFTVSFFSTAKSLEEIEVEAKVIGEKGRLASVVIEVRRRSNGELIALGKQWMASHSNHVHATSKL